MFGLRSTGANGDDAFCGCVPRFDEATLVVDADECDAGGDLAADPECRATVVETLTSRDVDAVAVRTEGLERSYDDAAVDLLVAAGRLAEAADAHDERLAETARWDPLAAAREVTGRSGPLARVVADTELAARATEGADYDRALPAFSGPRLSRWRVRTAPPPDATVTDSRRVDDGHVVRIYDVPGEPTAHYHLDTPEADLDPAALATLERAYGALAEGDVDGGRRGPHRAVRAVASDDPAVERLGDLLRKHTRGYGLLEDLFADPAVGDVFVTAPATDNPVRVTVEGRTLRTNVRLTADGVAALASRFRRESGRPFSRATPTLDASVRLEGRRVRVAGVTEPVSDGLSFAFRAHDRSAWTVAALVANGTLPPRAAALLSLAVERGRAVLVAGARGAGKTTLLAALLWELPPSVRTVVIEDAPELPIERLQAARRDVLGLRAADGAADVDPTDALRTALRLGDGALVVGEVRGEEAGVLYEAMRVGANSEAILGTIHGHGGESVYDRVVEDLGVSPASFGVTDAVATVEVDESGAEPTHCVASIEEVTTREAPGFEPLIERTGDETAPTGRVERGNSRLVDSMAEPKESYSDVLAVLDRRQSRLTDLAATGRTAPHHREGTPEIDS